MLNWALAFLLLAIVAALFGFTDMATASAGISKILFFVFAIVSLLALAMSIKHKA